MSSTRQIGLVLGAGGAVGHAFHSGVLAAITDVTGWDARDADLVVGTSAGSVVGALLRAGISTTDLAARATDQPVTAEGLQLFARSEDARAHLPPIPSRGSRSRIPTMSAPGAFLHAARRPWNLSVGGLTAAAMPEGRVPTELVASGITPLFERWPDDPLWITAVALDTSRRVTFGRDLTPNVDVATAVAASCAIPAFFAPVIIEERRYVDGGVHSLTNTELVAGLGLDLVVVVSPMSVATSAVRFAADQPARRLARARLGREVARVRADGTPVMVFQPTHADLRVMGINSMDASRHADVTRQARESAANRLARADARAFTALLSSSRPA